MTKADTQREQGLPSRAGATREDALTQLRRMTAWLNDLGFAVAGLSLANTVLGMAYYGYFRFFIHSHNEYPGLTPQAPAAAAVGLCATVWTLLILFDWLRRKARVLSAATAGRVEQDGASVESSIEVHRLLLSQDLPLVPGPLGLVVYLAVNLGVVIRLLGLPAYPSGLG